MAVTRANIINATWPGVDKWFGDGFQAAVSRLGELFAMRSSDKSHEVTTALQGLGLADVVGEGQGFNYDQFRQVYANRYDHVKYVKGIRITKEAYTDNQYNLSLFQPRSYALGFSMAVTKEIHAANVLNNGFSTSYTMGSESDGAALFSASHVAGPGAANFSNLLASADLSEVALENAVITITNFNDNRGIRVGLTADKLVVPNGLQFDAARILKSTMQNDTANNAINALMATGAVQSTPVVWSHLTDADAWFVTTSINRAGMGLAFYDRWPLEFGVDNDFTTGDACYKAEWRGSAGWDDPRGIVGNQGA